jgi:putative NIF3 family GTP cyclohydrolase 1 type 2
MPSARTIREYLLSNSPWVNPSQTVDTIKSGDADREVTKAGVCWFAAMDTIRAAHEAGCELLICHEPVFWTHEAAETFWRDKEPGLSKSRFLKATGMIILRAHDTWDQWPEEGIRDSWAAFLGLTERICTSVDHNFHAIYAVPAQTLHAFARHVADRVRALGEDGVRVMGDPERIIAQPAVGVGCIGPDRDIVESGADVLVLCYDGAPYWAVRERLYEMGAAIITVEHGTSEMPGLENLCRHLSAKFAEIEFVYFANHPKPWTVLGGT